VTKDTAHVELSIELDSDPITGLVSHGSQNSRPFSGWVELVAAIEAARSPGASSGGSGEAHRQTLGSRPGAKASEL